MRDRLHYLLRVIFAIIIVAAAVIGTVAVIRTYHDFHNPVIVTIGVIWMDIMSIIIFVAAILGIEIPDDRSDD